MCKLDKKYRDIRISVVAILNEISAHNTHQKWNEKK